MTRGTFHCRTTKYIGHDLFDKLCLYRSFLVHSKCKVFIFVEFIVIKIRKIQTNGKIQNILYINSVNVNVVIDRTHQALAIRTIIKPINITRHIIWMEAPTVEASSCTANTRGAAL